MAKSSAAFNIIFGAKTENLTKALRTVDTQLRQTAAKFNKIGRSMTVGVTAPLAAIGASSFKVAADFEQAMAKVLAVSGATSSEFDKLQKNARELGASTRYSATEVAALQLEFAKLGFTASEIENVTGATLALAQASGSDLAASAEVAGATLRAFGLSASETGRVTDVMAASFSSSALDLETFSDSMKYVAPVAKAAGVSVEQASALLGVLANNGIKGSQAGTSLRRILQEISGQGLEFGEAMRMSADQVINLADAKDEVGRSASSAFLVLKEGLKDVDGLTASLEHSQGAAAAMAATMDDTSKGGIARMRSALEGAQITIGDALAPTVMRLVGVVEQAATAFGNMSSGGQTFALALAGIAAAVGPVSSAIGGLLGTVRNLVPTLRKLSIFLAANPWLAAAAAIGAVVAALYAMHQNSREVSESVRRMQQASERAQKSYGDEAGKVEALAVQYRAAGDDMKQRARIMEELKSAAPAYFGNLDAEKTSYDELATSVGRYRNSLRAAAIQKAFGDELASIEVERVKIAEQLFQAQQRLAVAEQNLADAREAKAKAGGLALAEGNAAFEASGEFFRARKALAELTKQQQDLAAASAEVAAAVERANANLAASEAVGGATTTAGLLDFLNNVQPTISATVEAKVVKTPTGDPVEVPVVYQVEPTELDRVMEQLGTQLREAAAAVTLNGDQLAYLEQQATAYRAAAVEAQVLGSTELASKMWAEAMAAQALADGMNRTADRTHAAYMAAEQLGMSLDTLSTATSGDLLTALNQYGTATDNTAETTTTWAQQSEAVADAIGTQLASAMQSAASGAQSFGQAMKAAGREILKTLLAEAVARAIVNAFQTAKYTGPGAAIAGPVLAAAGAAAVYGLFNAIPALAQGGITTGPTLALIGDNPGGQEVVMPLDRLTSMMRQQQAQGGAVTVSGRLSGRDLIISGQRATRYTERTGAL